MTGKFKRRVVDDAPQACFDVLSPKLLLCGEYVPALEFRGGCWDFFGRKTKALFNFARMGGREEGDEISEVFAVVHVNDNLNNKWCINMRAFWTSRKSLQRILASFIGRLSLDVSSEACTSRIVVSATQKSSNVF